MKNAGSKVKFSKNELDDWSLILQNGFSTELLSLFEKHRKEKAIGYDVEDWSLRYKLLKTKKFRNSSLIWNLKHAYISVLNFNLSTLL